jgi:small subunit ribosomal protein S20
MAHTQSAKKRIRQTIARTAINRSIIARVRSLRKKVAEAVTGNDKEAAVVAYNVFASAIDKAAKKGVVPANRAANYKSKAAKAVATIA